jgi:transcriptional regulator with XRE-family HTH domain
MNEVIGTNIRQLREEKPWTQEQLAQAAALDVRTVQRAERGRGMSAETLQAIAGALDVSIEDLRFDVLEKLGQALGVPRDEVTPELVAAKAEEIRERYVFVPLTVVRARADLDPIYGSMALSFDCKDSDDRVRGMAAELESYLHDLMDVAGELDAVARWEMLEGAFALVEKLTAVGQAVAVGLHHATLAPRNGSPMKWTVFFAVVCPASTPTTVAAIPKGAVFSPRF